MIIKILQATSVLLIVISIVLILYEPVKVQVFIPKKIEKTHEVELSVTAAKMKENLTELSEKENQDELFNYDSVRTLTSQDSEPISNIDGVIGFIKVPSVNMEIPIKYGVTEDVLQNSVGTMKPNQVMGEGNYVLIGHNHFNPNMLFAPIRNISKGDSIFISDKSKVYEYSMISSEVVPPERIDVINDVEEKELLTLVSCYSTDGSDRIVVQAELVDVTNFE